ncbi:MAG: DNA polymerase, partial [Myxococcota bacterium]
MLVTGKDTETVLRRWIDAPPKWLSAEIDPDGRGGTPAVLVLAAAGGQAQVFDLASLAPGFFNLFSQLACPVAAFEAKEVARGLLRRGVSLPNRFACLRIIQQLLDGGRRSGEARSLDGLANRHLGRSSPDPRSGLDELAAVPGTVSEILERQIGAIRADALVWVSRIESSALPAIAEMEHHGVPIDAPRWRALLEEGREERAGLGQELVRLLGSGGDLFGAAKSLESDPGLRSALQAAGIQVPNLKRDTLAALPAPLGPKLGRFRELAKLTQAYGTTFLENIDSDGRIHATFEQIGASTGRMACHSPNLQSVVKDSPYRGCFRATDRRALITADYAGCELRIIAELSADPVFRRTFAEGGDLHSSVASTVFGRPVSKTENPELRHRAKAINFGLAYGMGAGGLARATGMSLEESRGFLERYFKAFPRIREFLEYTAAEAIERGYAQTMTGRRMYVEHDGTKDGRARAERVAKNMPIQGTNADVVKIALSRLRQTFATSTAFVVNTVHDEIVVECDRDNAEETAVVVRREMEAAG